MPQIPLLRPEEVVKVFEKFGWSVARQKGSHIILTKENSIATLSIPKHAEVARGTLRALIKASGIDLEEFIKAIK